MENIDNVLASDPTYSLAIYYKAYSLYGMGEYKRAENILLWYLEQYPNDDVAHSVLGSIYRGLGDLNLAEKEFQESLRLNPNNAVTFNNFSFVYDGENNEKALELLKEAIRLSPNDKIIENNFKNSIETIKNEKRNKDTYYKFFLNQKEKLKDFFTPLGFLMSIIIFIAVYIYYDKYTPVNLTLKVYIILFLIYVIINCTIFIISNKYTEKFDKKLEKELN